jgi:hypothetical protein
MEDIEQKQTKKTKNMFPWVAFVPSVSIPIRMKNPTQRRKDAKPQRPSACLGP